VLSLLYSRMYHESKMIPMHCLRLVQDHNLVVFVVDDNDRVAVVVEQIKTLLKHTIHRPILNISSIILE
jgi:PII-like signaling protein